MKDNWAIFLFGVLLALAGWLAREQYSLIKSQIMDDHATVTRVEDEVHTLLDHFSLHRRDRDKSEK